MDLNKIIKKVIKESVIKKLTEAKNIDNDDFYVLKTKTGGVLLLPKSSNPIVKGIVNKPEFKKILNSTEEIRNFAKRGFKITENCKRFYKDLDLDSCYLLYTNWYYSILADGGITKFEATSPVDGKRYLFRACMVSKDDIKFEERTLAGYYPNADNTTNVCSGNPWTMASGSDETESGFDFNFDIKLQMIK
jgi:hypothetical protein